MTLAESVLWDALCPSSIDRHDFLRQYIIGDYIVDFLCRDNGLIIEVDGGYHSEPRQADEDGQRTEWLESKGYLVLRFTNDEVLYNVENVLNEIEQSLK